ncbi:MAG: bifunctional folylpolyglutamate synthase/dihydrofolate synthase [Kiritimatiellae bacterium]|nr:bifunctional folylpolyglutamate synthase/dihydrofolate synthase [Kiritimatiellia bacterium]
MTSPKSFRARLDALRTVGVRPGLASINALLEELGHPERELKCVHVAGTNGKGAVCALIDAMMRSAGYHTARFASPHLLALNERFFLDGEPASDAVLEEIADELFAAVDRVAEQGYAVTFFEGLTVAALLLFRKANPDVVVLEAGMGGRDDATNVLVQPLVSVITRVGLDHCEWLGSTHVAIAEVKAGILKPGCPVVCGAMPESARETIARRASLMGCAFTAAEDHVSVQQQAPLVLTTSFRNPPPIDFALAGTFQVENVATALTAVDVLCKEHGYHVSDVAVKEGLENVVWPGRFQRLTKDGVPLIIDGAHNPDGSMALRDAIREAHVAEPIAFVCGFCGDKDVLANLRILSAVGTHGWAVPLTNARSLDPKEVVERMTMAGFVKAEACTSLKEGLKAAVAWAREAKGTVVVCGSLFLAGEALVTLGAFPWTVRAVDDNEFFARSR